MPVHPTQIMKRLLMHPMFPTLSPQLTRAKQLQPSSSSPNSTNSKSSQFNTLSKDTVSFGASVQRDFAPGSHNASNQPSTKGASPVRFGNDERKSIVPGFEMVDATWDTDYEVLTAQDSGKPVRQWEKSAEKAYNRLAQRKRRLAPESRAVDRSRGQEYKDSGRRAEVEQEYQDSGRRAEVEQEYKDSGRQAKAQQEYKDSGRRAVQRQKYKDSGRLAEVNRQYQDSGRQAAWRQAYERKERTYNTELIDNLDMAGFNLERCSVEDFQSAREQTSGKRGSKRIAQRILKSRIRQKKSEASGSGSQASSSTRGLSQQLAHSPIQTPKTPKEADEMMRMGRQMMAVSLNWKDRQAQSDIPLELVERPPTPINTDISSIPEMYWDGEVYRPVTPPNSWSQRFLNYFKNPDGSYSDPTNPDDPANYPGFNGYDDQGRPKYAIFSPDGSFAGYSYHPQLRGG